MAVRDFDTGDRAVCTAVFYEAERDEYAGMGFQLGSVQPDGYGPGLDRCDMRLEARSTEESHGSD